MSYLLFILGFIWTVKNVATFLKLVQIFSLTSITVCLVQSVTEMFTFQKLKINHNYVQKFNFYVKENRPCVYYKDQSSKTVQGKIDVYCDDNK